MIEISGIFIYIIFDCLYFISMKHFYLSPKRDNEHPNEDDYESRKTSVDKDDHNFDDVLTDEEFDDLMD